MDSLTSTRSTAPGPWLGSSRPTVFARPLIAAGRYELSVEGVCPRGLADSVDVTVDSFGELSETPPAADDFEELIFGFGCLCDDRQ